MKILFQGDSITDAGRDRNDPHNLGNGYPKYAADLIKARHPDTEFEFVNLGISGNRVENLRDRWQADCIDWNPDVVSILIGVNDTWHHSDDRSWIPAELFEERLRTVLDGIRNRTNAKIMILEPFLIPIEDKEFFREDLDFKIDIVRKLALEYADVYLPTDGLLWSAYIGDDPLSFAADGVHPTEKGAEFIGKMYAEYIRPIIDGLIK